MPETRAPYESGPAPAPAATCPCCGTACTVTRKPVTLAPPDSEVAVYLVDAYEIVYEPLPVPDPDPLTALEREALEAGIEHDGAMQMVPIADQDGDRETRHVAREYVKETKRTLRKAVDALQAARAAVGREGAG